MCLLTLVSMRNRFQFMTFTRNLHILILDRRNNPRFIVTKTENIFIAVIVFSSINKDSFIMDCTILVPGTDFFWLFIPKVTVSLLSFLDGFIPL